MLVEVCANSLESALNAEKAGVDRIELCSELAVGGVTPSYGLLKSIKKYISIPVHVLIRPRSGDFTYSEYDFEIMKQDIELCVDLGFEGIVSGVLHKDFSLDFERTAVLRKASGTLKFTFHRAFDWVKDPLSALGRLEDISVDYILSSGQRKSAPEGIELLAQLHRNSTTCTIMPGGGIRPENVHFFKEIGFKAIHLSGVKFERTLPSEPMVSMNSPSFLKDDELGISDVETLRGVVNEVK
ncbi:copper homeostasis protein CutC [Maribacter halichondriae]|uniref:copper homeostasis protein CutC n=1 Tax=Maribacter halichondriae TaxID=2980554 RepID=UPI0023583175|nr:copper homeostasis protein CutC [Maribacter sp. Hal144]